MNKISFKYNGKLYNPKNPEKKLKQLGITWNDVKIIEQTKKEEIIEYEDKQLYYFKNNKTGETIVSVYNNLDNLFGIVKNLNDYERCTKENAKNDWN